MIRLCNIKFKRGVLALLVAVLLPCASVQQQMPSVKSVPAGAQATPEFNPDTATEAYLAQIPTAARARSDAYFEGGYWLQLWDFLIAVAVSLVLLQLRWSAKMRDLAARITCRKPLQTFIYWVEYLLLTAILTSPMAIYEGYFREHQYGLATQTFGLWLNDQFKGLLVNLVLGGVLLVILFIIVRRLPRAWWIAGGVVSELFLVFAVMITPVYLVPIFNKVSPLNDPKLTGPILSMARANGISAREVYQMDASKQSTRMSANVSGLGGTMRITLTDNLLQRGSPEEIQSVMGHEMGHYVLHHVYQGMIFGLILIVFAFAFLKWSIDWTLQRWGAGWGIRGLGDPAILPLVMLLITLLGFVGTPVINTIIRTQEHEADMYGINASRKPDGFAQAAIHLAEFRKMRPGPIEEFIFFDHPSGYRRIHDAMQWKAENLDLLKQ